MEFACKPGQKVRIRKGMFEGVEGTLKSMKKHLCVVIPVNGITAVAITNIPKKYLQKIDDE
jgi:transcription antitermination factor NusG